MKKHSQKQKTGSSSMRKQYPTHVFVEDKKQIWALCTSSLSAMAISKRMQQSFPDYELCLTRDRESFIRMGGKV